jgi:hypothetical protein
MGAIASRQYEIVVTAQDAENSQTAAAFVIVPPHHRLAGSDR